MFISFLPGNPNTERFLQFLLERFRTKGSKSSSFTTSPSNNKVYARPLERPNQKMVRRANDVVNLNLFWSIL